MHVLHIIFLQQAYQIGGEMGRMRSISVLANHENFKQTEYNSKTTFYKEKYSI